LYRCRFRSTSFYPPATSPSAFSRVKILQHFSDDGDDSVLGEEVSFGAGRGRCHIGLSCSCASPTKAATSSVLASAFFTGAILSLFLSERAIFGDGDSFSFAEHERFGWSPFAFGRDHLPRPGGPVVASSVMVVVVASSANAGFLLPLPTPELQRSTLVHRARCVMEGSWHRILQHFQCLELCFRFGRWIWPWFRRSKSLRSSSKLR
jgi:hypothetical protein